MICSICSKEINQLQARRRTRCNSCNTKIRRHRTKQAAVKLLGGKCSECGWTGNIAAFDFHHPEKNKEFNIGSCANKSWEVIVKEVMKCILLCSNCHAIKHSNRTEESFIKEVANYKGRMLGPLA